MTFVDLKKSRWRVTGMLMCQSRLQIGDSNWLEDRIPVEDRSDGDIPEVASVYTMPDSQGGRNPYIPGTSLKGWLRAFAEQTWKDADGADRIQLLFGERKDGQQGGALEFHDAPMSGSLSFVGEPPRDWDATRKTCVAPHVVINRETGAAAHNLLYFEEYVPEGGAFDVTVTAERVPSRYIFALVELLAQFEQQCPARLGGNLSQGHGDVRWRLKQIEGLTQERLDAWLENPTSMLTDMLAPCAITDLEGAATGTAPRAQWLEFEVQLEFEGGFLVNDPFRAKPKRRRQDVSQPDSTPRRNPDGSYVLPSSSLRGRLRAQAEKIQRTLRQPAMDPSSQQRVERPTTISELHEVGGLDLTSKLFGAPGWRSLVQPADLLARSGIPYRQEFVAIDRFTGGSAREKKFTADALWRPRITGVLRLDYRRLQCCGDIDGALNLLHLVLRDLVDGLLPIGHGTSKGFGACTGAVDLKGAAMWEHAMPPELFQRLRRIEPLPPLAAGQAPGPTAIPTCNPPSGKFFNPYHFVPALEQPRYAEPASHSTYNGEALHGRICCELRNFTPLFVGAGRDDHEPHPKPVRPSVVPGTGRDDGYPGDPLLPASSLRGMISSMAEAASNSALRILDTPKVYSRRSIVNPGLHLNEALSAIGVLVRRTREGHTGWYLRPLCLPFANNGRYPSFWRTIFPEPRLRVYIGSRESIQGNGFVLEPIDKRTWTPDNRIVSCKRVARHHWVDDRVVSPGPLKTAGPVLLAAEENNAEPQTGIVRVLGCLPQRSIPKTKKHELWLPFPDAATYSVTGEWDPAEASQLLPVPEPVMETFRLLADDMNEHTRENEAPKPYEPFGTRSRSRGEGLTPRSGDLVYFDCNAREVTEIAYSSIWRKRIPGTAEQFFARLSPHLLPLGHRCRTDPRLTIAEAMFGVTEERAEKSEDELTAWRSRIRISNGIWQGTAGAAPWLEPASPRILSTPKPPAPALYFKNDAGENPIHKRNLNAAHQRPQGRKFYLHHARALDENWQAWKATPQPTADGEHADQYVTIRPLAGGQSFRFHIDFENLSKAELGLLLYALRPIPGFAHKLGMGKPLGLGSVEVVPLVLHLWFPDLRYRDGTFPGWDDPKDLESTRVWQEYCTFAPQQEIQDAVAALGAAAYRNVRYPAAQDLGNNLRIREKIYEWFVANELGSKSPEREFREPAGERLEPINGPRVKPLHLLPIWPSGEN